jgi:hypothetical protein
MRAAKAERQYATDDQTVWPAPEALRLATAVIGRGNILPETVEHPIIKFECIKTCVLVCRSGSSSPLPPHAGSLVLALLLGRLTGTSYGVVGSEGKPGDDMLGRSTIVVVLVPFGGIVQAAGRS